MFKQAVAVIAVLVVGLSAMAAGGSAKQLSGVVNINTASASELMLLPGIGKGKADAIIAYRQTSPFKSAQELTKVKGIGEKMLSKIQQYVAVDGPTTAKVVKVKDGAQQAGLQSPGQKTGL